MCVGYLKSMVVMAHEGVVVDDFLSFQVEPHFSRLVVPADWNMKVCEGVGSGGLFVW